MVSLVTKSRAANQALKAVTTVQKRDKKIIQLE